MFVDRLVARLLQCLLSMDVGRALLVLALVARVSSMLFGNGRRRIRKILLDWGESNSRDTSTHVAFRL